MENVYCGLTWKSVRFSTKDSVLVGLDTEGKVEMVANSRTKSRVLKNMKIKGVMSCFLPLFDLFDLLNSYAIGIKK